MPRSLPLADHLPADQILARFRACRDRTERARWQVILLKSQGRTLDDIAAATSYTPNWASTIIRRYNEHGPKALRDRRRDHPGAPAMLSPDEQAALDAALATGRASDGGCWTGPKVARWIEQATGRERVHDQRGWEWMVRLGFSAQTPRPSHDGADAASQAALKK